jgi:hypothetical protein
MGDRAGAGRFGQGLADRGLDLGAAHAAPVGLAEALDHATPDVPEARPPGMVGERPLVEVLGVQLVAPTAPVGVVLDEQCRRVQAVLPG